MKHGPNTDAVNALGAKATSASSQTSGSAVQTSEVYPDPRFALPALVLGALTVVLLINLSVQWYWIASAVVGSLSVAGALQWKAFVEVEKKVVLEEGRLFGGRLLKQRITAVAEFEAVVLRYDAGESEEWLVGLRHHCGRKIWMRRYLWNDPKHSAPGHAADGFALMLSRETGLEIEDYHPQSLKQWLQTHFAR